MDTTPTGASYDRADRAVRDAFQSSIRTASRQAADSTYVRIKRSSLFGNGLLLMLAGFLGLFSGLTLQLQDVVISIYVLIFGLIMCTFAMGLGQSTLKRYFGFMYTSNGQLLFLIVAGNLAWSICWPFGVLIAIASNAHGFYAWRSGQGGELPGLASLADGHQGQ
eukprot:scaffold268831_cov31-Tisochrysis_lutea.AAC.2